MKKKLIGYKNAFFAAIAAGIFIGIGGTVLLSLKDAASPIAGLYNIIGACAFTIALLCICMMGLYLFTGKVGFLVYDHSGTNILTVVSGLLGNLVGTFLTAQVVRIARPNTIAVAQALVAPKLADQVWYQTILSGIMCGILMYTAVRIYRDHKSPVAIFFCVPVFILSGFEHSIADMFYFFQAGVFSLDVAVFLLLVIIGNAIGGMLLPLLRLLSGEKD